LEPFEGSWEKRLTELSEAEARSRSELDESPEAGARLGGQAVVAKYGREHMAQLGKKGSRAVVAKYGLRFYSEIAARNKGVKKRRAAEVEGA
jgi:hypothetical protein